MQLNSLYTTHDMRLSNILQQYDYTFRWLKIIYNLTHSILVILVLFLKFFNPFLEKSTRHFKTEKHLTFFDGFYIVSMKQFHKESVDNKI